jgi:uncharacterized membrane protein YidH (DUF202 family)
MPERNFIVSKKPLWVLVLSHPFELLIAFLCVVTGIPLMLGVHLSNSTAEVLPFTLQILWGVLLFIGGALAMLGLVRFHTSPEARRQILALRIEQSGWIMVATALFVFGFILVTLNASGAGFVLLTYAAFIAACVCRYIALRHAVRAYTKVIHQYVNDAD